MKLTTLCYIEKDDCYLMLHRTKKKDDLSRDMWIGVGGHFEAGESPDECLKREVKEETGLTLTSYRLRGIITFLYSDENTSTEEYMFLYTANAFEGELSQCDEGELKFIKKSELDSLYFWTGDEIFLRLIRENRPVFDLKLTYNGRTLKEAVLDGKTLELLDVLDENFEPSGIVRERSIVHELGSLHRTVHIWLVRKHGDRYEVLLQKRAENKDSYPGCYDISSAGHISAGDDYLTSAIRELKEELGINADLKELKLIGTHRADCDEEFYGKPFLNHEYSYVYIYDMTEAKEDFNLQREEVEAVLWVDYDGGRELLRSGKLKNCVFIDEWDMLGKYLSNKYY